MLILSACLVVLSLVNSASATMILLYIVLLAIEHSTCVSLVLFCLMPSLLSIVSLKQLDKRSMAKFSNVIVTSHLLLVSHSATRLFVLSMLQLHSNLREITNEEWEKSCSSFYGKLVFNLNTF